MLPSASLHLSFLAPSIATESGCSLSARRGGRDIHLLALQMGPEEAVPKLGRPLGVQLRQQLGGRAVACQAVVVVPRVAAHAAVGAQPRVHGGAEAVAPHHTQVWERTVPQAGRVRDAVVPQRLHLLQTRGKG